MAQRLEDGAYCQLTPAICLIVVPVAVFLPQGTILEPAVQDLDPALELGYGHRELFAP